MKNKEARNIKKAKKARTIKSTCYKVGSNSTIAPTTTKNTNSIVSSTNEEFHEDSTGQWPFSLVITQGSVLDFKHPLGAIVNAANDECIGGGGVDGAISVAGGKLLHKHRVALPVIENEDSDYEIRCPTGQAKITGPGRYGRLGVDYVIHAVGPIYGSSHEKGEVALLDELLRSAYLESMMRARENKLKAVGFSLLSAGVFRGCRSLEAVLKIGMDAICDFGGYEELEEVHLFGFQMTEIEVLLQIASEKDFFVREEED